MTDLVSSKIFLFSALVICSESVPLYASHRIRSYSLGQLWKRKILSLFAVLKVLGSECQIIVITSIHIETKGED